MASYIWENVPCPPLVTTLPDNSENDSDPDILCKEI